jgi:ATP-dependent DNA ligase
MLARLARELPVGDYLYEPKWDGFRALVFADEDGIDLRSRHGRPLARYFPELVEALAELPSRPFVVDGEIVVVSDGFDFAALMSRLHPTPSRVARLREERPATFIAFDLLALAGDELLDVPFVERRRALEALFRDARRPLMVTPITEDPEVARRWIERYQGAGVDGVVAKERGLAYQPGKRAMVKVKRERTADCVVAGFRWLSDRPALGSILLGLYDGEALRHVGVVASFSEPERAELLETLTPLVTDLAGHPWEHGFGLGRSPVGRLLGAAGRWAPDEMAMDWVPLRPELVCEVAYDQVDDGRLRHPARFRRWRPDRDPRSCLFDQLAEEEHAPAELFA